MPRRAQIWPRVSAAIEAALSKDAALGKPTIVKPARSSARRSVRSWPAKGFSAFVLSLVGILAYIAFRFQLSFAVGAVVATLHDILVTLAFLAFFQYDMSLNVIAAILTVTGYSTNDTIVIFDRVRENLRSHRRESLSDVINIGDQPDARPNRPDGGPDAPVRDCAVSCSVERCCAGFPSR